MNAAADVGVEEGRGGSDKAAGGIESANFRQPTGAGSDQNFRATVAVDVSGPHEQTGGLIDIKREELAQEYRQVSDGKNADMRSAAGARAGDDLGKAVASDIPGRDRDAAGKAGMIREEVGEKSTAPSLKHSNVGPAAGSRPGDDIGCRRRRRFRPPP